MYGVFTYIYHKHQPNVGKYIIHGSYQYGSLSLKGPTFFSRTASNKGIPEGLGFGGFGGQKPAGKSLQRETLKMEGAFVPWDPVGTPWKMNGWNLQPSPMKRKENDLNQTSMRTCSMLIFRGVRICWEFTIRHFPEAILFELGRGGLES